EVPAAWRRHAGTRAGVTVNTVGFGRCIVTPDAASAKWDAERWRAVFDDCARTGQPVSDNRSLSDLNRSLAPVDDLSVPRKGLLLMTFLFAVAVGPVSVWLLSRYNRRIWLLWTVPAVSLFTCMAVFGFVAISEGWQGHARATGLTVLDETEKRATTIGR